MEDGQVEHFRIPGESIVASPPERIYHSRVERRKALAMTKNLKEVAAKRQKPYVFHRIEDTYLY